MFKFIIIIILLQNQCTINGVCVKFLQKSHKALEGQFPYHAYIFMPTGKNTAEICGGSIISHYFIITAAHCVYNVKKMKIGLGSIQQTRHQEIVYPLKITIHPKYEDGHYGHDIAIIKTNTTIIFDKYIKPIKLPTKSMISMNFAGKIAKVCGFGRVYNSDYTMLNFLQWMTVNILPRCECMKYISFIKHSTICGRGTNQAICLGDSGGGLVENINGVDFLIGIVSFRSKSSCAKAPAAYEKVTSHLDFISKVTKINILP